MLFIMGCAAGMLIIYGLNAFALTQTCLYEEGDSPLKSGELSTKATDVSSRFKFCFQSGFVLYSLLFLIFVLTPLVS
jgi:hypothetical protein